MKTNMVGPSYQERSLVYDCRRTINLYPVIDDGGKEPSALYKTPGLDLFGSGFLGAGRGCYFSTTGRAFAVTGTDLYEFDRFGSDTFQGSLITSTGNVSIAENGLQLAICDGTNLYIFTYATDTLVQVTDADLPSCGTVAFIDGYFVVNKNDSGSFYISALYDGTSWDPLDFATAESSPDNLYRVTSAVGQLWLLGERTTEVWTNTGDSAFPFSRISGAKLEVGIFAPHTAIEVDNSLFWVGKSKEGFGIVYRADGFTPQRISTSAIEEMIQATITVETNAISPLRAYTYQQDGHVFYVVTGGVLVTTLVYDVTTQQWFEKAALNADGVFEQHWAYDCMFAFHKHIVVSRINAKLYEMSQDYLDDFGSPIACERVWPHISDEDKRIRYNRLEIAFESGVGITDTGFSNSDPQMLLSISGDGGRTYSNAYAKPMGKLGQYFKRIAYRRLGIYKDVVFKVRITDSVKVVLIGGYLS